MRRPQPRAEIAPEFFDEGKTEYCTHTGDQYDQPVGPTEQWDESDNENEGMSGTGYDDVAIRTCGDVSANDMRSAGLNSTNKSKGYRLVVRETAALSGPS
jgi:hypothetical protein